jgi:hypothetical protein
MERVSSGKREEMAIAPVAKIEDEEVKKKAEALVVQAKALVVTNPEEAARAVEFGKACKGLRSQITEFFKPLKKAFDDGKKIVLDREKETLSPVDEAEALASRAVTTWRIEEDRRAREERERLEREERQRQEAERLRAVDHALKKGDEKQAERIFAKPLPAPVVPKTAAPPKIEGIRRRKVWKYEIVDTAKLPREFLTPDEKAIGAFVRAKKEDAKIEGVRIWAEDETDF